MAGMFDDLIPQEAEEVNAPVGVFDDLIPEAEEVPAPSESDAPSYWDAIGSMFDRGSEILKDSGEEIVKGVPYGVIQGVGGIKRGNELEIVQKRLDMINQMDAGESPEWKDPVIEVQYRTASPEAKAEYRNTLMRQLSGEDSTGQRILDAAEEYFPAPEGKTMVTDVSRAIGSTMPYLTGGAGASRLFAKGGSAIAEYNKGAKLAKELGYNPMAEFGSKFGAYGAPAWMGTQHARQEVFSDAIREGVGPIDALEYANDADVIGASEAVPIAKWVRKLDKGTNGGLSKTLKDMAVEGSEEVVQELGSSFLKDLFAQSTYDADRDLWVWNKKIEEGEVAFSAAAIISLLTSMVSRRGGGGVSTPNEILPPTINLEPQEPSDLPEVTIGIPQQPAIPLFASEGEAQVESAIGTLQARLEEVLKGRGEALPEGSTGLLSSFKQQEIPAPTTEAVELPATRSLEEYPAAKEPPKALEMAPPDPMVVFPDGTVAAQSEVDKLLTEMEAEGKHEEALLLRAKLAGYGQQEATAEEITAEEQTSEAADEELAPPASEEVDAPKPEAPKFDVMPPSVIGKMKKPEVAKNLKEIGLRADGTVAEMRDRLHNYQVQQARILQPKSQRVEAPQAVEYVDPRLGQQEYEDVESFIDSNWKEGGGEMGTLVPKPGAVPTSNTGDITYDYNAEDLIRLQSENPQWVQSLNEFTNKKTVLGLMERARRGEQKFTENQRNILDMVLTEYDQGQDLRSSEPVTQQDVESIDAPAPEIDFAPEQRDYDQSWDDYERLTAELYQKALQHDPDNAVRLINDQTINPVDLQNRLQGIVTLFEEESTNDVNPRRVENSAIPDSVGEEISRSAEPESRDGEAREESEEIQGLRQRLGSLDPKTLKRTLDGALKELRIPLGSKTIEEKIEAAVSTREVIAAFKPYSTTAEIEDAIDSGELSKQDLYRWGMATTDKRTAKAMSDITYMPTMGRLVGLVNRTGAHHIETVTNERKAAERKAIGEQQATKRVEEQAAVRAEFDADPRGFLDKYAERIMEVPESFIADGIDWVKSGNDPLMFTVYVETAARDIRATRGSSEGTTAEMVANASKAHWRTYDKTGGGFVSYQAAKSKGSTAPEHQGNLGKPLDEDDKYDFAPDSREALSQDVIDESTVPEFLSAEEFKEVTDEWVNLIANPDEKTITERRVKGQGGYISPEEAQARIQSWKDRVYEQYENHRGKNSDKTILSLFDHTGEWSKPWEEAGYNVIRFDIQDGLDINDFSVEYFTENWDFGEVYGILAACPCTDFASSGARHFATKDADGRTEASKELVFQTLRTIEYFRPKFWVLENPVGRIERLTGLPKARMTFDPNHFGEDYTKKTVLWGKFNTDLPLAPVEPTAGSKMHVKFGGKSLKTKNARSATPEGFSYAFFMANNEVDLPVEDRMIGKYPEASGAVRQALKAGVTEEQIEEAMEYTYGDYDYEAARNALVRLTAEATENQSAPLEDVGEKIGGARKDLWGGFREKIEADLNEDEMLSMTLGKVFPAPNYKKLAEQGVPVQSLALIRALRGQIPTKGRQNYKRRAWLKAVVNLREVAAQVMDDPSFSEQYLSKAAESSSTTLNNLSDQVDLMVEMGFPDIDAFGYSVDYRNFKERNPETGKLEDVSKWMIQDHKSRRGWPYVGNGSESREDAVEQLKTHLAAQSSKPKGKRETKFEVYRYRGKAGERGWVVGKKLGRNYIDIEEGFESGAAAREYLSSHQSDLEEKLQRLKQIPAHRKSENDPRLGEDYRQGRDVGAEEFRETFGFRGVEFGNWVDQKKRQQEVNNAYDGLMDLALLLDVPPKALSLNGEMGLAFGARGSGGKNAANAHYEPGKVVINLTKNKGAGSLAHEWWHGLDNYFSRMQGGNVSYMTDSRKRGNGEVRPEMVERFDGVMKAIQGTNLKERSSKLDGRRSKPYWNTDVEMSARSFESYIINRLKEKGLSNDYLANIVSPEAWTATETLGLEADNSYPYVLESELESVTEAYDAFFNEIQTKETDQGIAFYEEPAEYSTATLSAQGRAGSLDGETPERVVKSLRRHPTSILANGLADGYEEQQHVRLIGQQVDSAEDLAVLGQVYRNPSFETFRVFYTQGGKVVGQTGVTSRMPNVVNVGDISQDVEDDMERLGADGWWVLHNHPSGDPTPSSTDKRMTNSIAARVRGFQGHIVIDHNKYALINDQGRSTTHPLPKSAMEKFRYDVNKPSVPHNLLKVSISDPKTAASVARSLAHDQDNYFQIVSRNRLGIRGIMDVPVALLDDLHNDLDGHKVEALALLHQFARQTGGGELFAMNVPGRYGKTIFTGVKEDVLVDVITRDGSSVREQLGVPWEQSAMGIQPKSIQVNEEQGDYRTTEQTTTVVVGKDSDGHSIRLQSNHPSLRDQSRLKLYAKRMFAKEGNLGKEAFERKIEADGLKSAEEVDNAFFLAELGRVVKEGYGKRIQNLSDAEMQTLNDALAGREVELPAVVREVVRNMRTYLDTQSGRVQEMLLDNISYRLEDLSPEKRAAAIEQIVLIRDAIGQGITEMDEMGLDLGSIDKRVANAARVYVTIQANKGVYLNRSYQAFDDANWAEKVRKDHAVMDAARNYLRERYREAEPDLADNEIEDFVDAAIGEMISGKHRDLLSFMVSSQLGQKNLGILKKRKEIAPELRALMGGYKDPRVNFARSASKMSYLLANHHFLKSVREDGLGSWLSKRGSGRMDTKITAFEPDSMSPLDGLYATKEMAEALKDATEPEVLEGWLKYYLRANSAVKVGKTILAPTTTFRNFYSAMMFTVMNGHFDWSHSLKAAAVTWADLGGHKMKHKAYLRDLVKRGVLHDNPRSGELADLLNEMAAANPAKPGFHRRIFDVAQRIYRAGDDFWKIIGFENEKAALIKSGLQEEEAMKLAAKRIRDGYPTYSMVPKGIKLLRRFPVTGTFVSFPWEIMRTAKNQALFIYEDAKAGRKKDAARRAVGVMVASSITTAISKALMSVWGISDEDDEAVRSVSPPWQENAELAYTGFDEEGMPTYLDLSHLDPYTYIKRPVIALANGNYDGVEKVEKALTELFAPFFGLEITYSAITGVIDNKDPGTGRRVWNEAASVDRKVGDVLNYLRKNLQPGVASNIERTFKAFHDDYSPSGKKYDLTDELLAWIGFRFTTMNMKQALSYRAQDFGQNKRGSVQLLSKKMGSQSKVADDEILESYGDLRESWESVWQEMHGVINAAQALGTTQDEIRNVLVSSGISRKDVAALLSGQTPPWRPSKQFMRRAMMRAVSTATTPEREGELFGEFVRRRQVLRDAVR